MDPRAEELIQRLGLVPHPEGGAYREIVRSPRAIPIEGAARSALTHIYYLIAAGQHSRWHQVPHDEVWHFYDGAPLELIWAPADLSTLERLSLAPPTGEDRAEPVAVVPGGCWQTAATRGAWSLAGCTLAPGFEFSDLVMLADHPSLAAELRRRHPDLAPRL